MENNIIFIIMKFDNIFIIIYFGDFFVSQFAVFVTGHFSDFFFVKKI
jgi:hypothetical protein